MEDKGITPEQHMEAYQKIQGYYAEHGLDFYSIDWENIPKWWPPELVEANETIDKWFDQFPEGDLL